MQECVYLMDIEEATKIYTFGSKSPKADVWPSEPIFVLSSSQLQELIKVAVVEAIQPLQDRVRELKDTVALQGEKIAALEATQDTQGENELNMLRLINDLRKKDPGKTEISRAEKIEKYLEARSDHKASFETLKGYLQVDNVRLNEAIKILVATSERSYFVQKEKTGDKRKRILVMLPR